MAANIRMRDQPHRCWGRGLFLSRFEWQSLRVFGLPRERDPPAALALAGDSAAKASSTSLIRCPGGDLCGKQDHAWWICSGATKAVNCRAVPLVLQPSDLRPLAEDVGARFAHRPISAAKREEGESGQLAAAGRGGHKSWWCSAKYNAGASPPSWRGCPP